MKENAFAQARLQEDVKPMAMRKGESRHLRSWGSYSMIIVNAVLV